VIVVIIVGIISCTACSGESAFTRAVENPGMREDYIKDLVEKTKNPNQENLIRVIYVNTPEEQKEVETLIGTEQLPNMVYMITGFTASLGKRPGNIFILEKAFSVSNEADFISTLKHEYVHVELENDYSFISFVEGDLARLIKTDKNYYWFLRENITELYAYGSQLDDPLYKSLSDGYKKDLMNVYMDYYRNLSIVPTKNADENLKSLLDSLKTKFYRSWMKKQTS